MGTKKDIERRAKKIRLVCTDVDGVLTDGHMQYGPESGHWKQFYVRDGVGIKALQKSGIPVVFISGQRSEATDKRAKDLGVEDCFTGIATKVSLIEKICTKYRVSFDEVAYVGDDMIDIGLLRQAGLAMCPRDAVPEVLEIAHWIVPKDGGKGVIRAVAEFILKSKGLWEGLVDSYLNEK
ncbi:MAG: HAD hydrolase family protein [Holophagaceae bacterium]|nr:HAD hydrolase family protein [Holophagaceae bacterium]